MHAAGPAVPHLRRRQGLPYDRQHGSGHHQTGKQTLALQRSSLIGTATVSSRQLVASTAAATIRQVRSCKHRSVGHQTGQRWSAL